MVKCGVCGKKVSFWKSYGSNNINYCPECYKKRNERENREKEEIEREEEGRRKKLEEEKNKIREYKRKCNQCGKVWYSLVSQEKSISTGGFLSSLVGIGTALTGNLGASTQSSRNSDALMQRIEELKKCPNCGSSDYTEEIIVFDKKKK